MIEKGERAKGEGIKGGKRREVDLNTVTDWLFKPPWLSIDRPAPSAVA